MRRRRPRADPFADFPPELERFAGSPWDTDGADPTEAEAAWDGAREAWAEARGLSIVDVLRETVMRRRRAQGIDF